MSSLFLVSLLIFWLEQVSYLYPVRVYALQPNSPLLPFKEWLDEAKHVGLSFLSIHIVLFGKCWRLITHCHDIAWLAFFYPITFVGRKLFFLSDHGNDRASVISVSIWSCEPRESVVYSYSVNPMHLMYNNWELSSENSLFQEYFESYIVHQSRWGCKVTLFASSLIGI